MDRSDLYAFIWLFVLYFYLIAVSNFVPEGAMQKGLQIAGVAILVCGMVVTDFVIRERVNKYPYIRARVEPSGKVLRIFVEDWRDRQVDKTLWSLKIKAKWPVTIKGLGKVKEFIINHEWPIHKRVNFRPGQATWFGYVVDHPQTEFMVLYEYPTVTSVDHAQPVPVYWLKHASQDYYLPEVPITKLVKSNNPGVKDLPLILKLHKAVEQLKAELAEARRAAFFWHEKAVELEDRVTQQETEIKGLLEQQSNFTADLVERLISLLAHCQTIEQAIKRVKGVGWAAFTFNKWLALTIISLGALIVLYAMRDSLGGVGIWLSNPVNMIFAFLVVALVCGILYLALVRKVKK